MISTVYPHENTQTLVLSGISWTQLEILETAFEFVDLHNYRDRGVRLSGGQRQRIAIALRKNIPQNSKPIAGIGD